MYSNLVGIKNNDVDQDELLKILNFEDNDLIEHFDDMKLISDLNSLMINFDTLDDSI